MRSEHIVERIDKKNYGKTTSPLNKVIVSHSMPCPTSGQMAALTGFEPIGKIPCRQTCPNEHLT